MATREDAQFVQNLIKYQFQDEKHLLLALTAQGAGGNEDGTSQRGNSRLAHLGSGLVQFILGWIGFQIELSRADTSTLSSKLGSTANCATVAKNVGLDRCLKYDVRGGSRTDQVLRKAVYAIFAAVFIDGGYNIHQVLSAMITLGFIDPEVALDPKLLEMDQAVVGDSLRRFISPALRDLDNDQWASPGGAQHNLLPEHPTNGTTIEETASPSSDPWPVTPWPGMDLVLASGFPPATSPWDAAADPFDAFIQSPQLDGQDQLPIQTPFHASPTPADGDTTPGRADKRRRIANPTSPDPAANADGAGACALNSTVASYLAEEATRCARHDWPPPETTFLKPHIHQRLLAIDYKHVNTLVLIHVTIAGCHAVNSLHEAVRSYRMGNDAFQIVEGASARALYHSIEQLNNDIALNVLLRRYHILHLYEECNPTQGSNFVMEQPGALQARGKAGNPRNNAKSEVTYTMMAAIFPDLDPATSSWQAKYRQVSKLQVLGRRLSILASRFHKGTLALLPTTGLAKPYDAGISDNMLSTLPDSAFSSLVDILDDSQGDDLRNFGKAAFRFLRPLIYDPSQEPTSQEPVPWGLSDYPKGSADLFRTLHQP